MPQNVGGNFGGNTGHMDKPQDQYGAQRRKNRVFAPVTMKMKLSDIHDLIAGAKLTLVTLDQYKN